MRAVLLAGVVFLIALPADAARGTVDQGVVDTYQDGNRRYQEGDFAGAADAYAAILESGVTAPELEYNLANAFLKQGRLGPAVLHYRRALKLDPTYENATQNLDYARSLTQDVKPEIADDAWGWVSRLRLGAPAAAAGLFVVFSLFWLIAGLRLGPWREKLGALVAQGAVAGVVILLGAALLFEWTQSRELREGVLVAEEIDVRAGPGESQTVSFRLHEGTEVELLRTAAGWTELKVSDGLQGWVPEDAVEAI